MYLPIDEQEIVNEIAKNAFVSEKFGKARSDLVKSHKALVDRYEVELRAGVPAEFEYEGSTIRCKLVMTPSPKWSARDCVVCVVCNDPR